MAAFLAGAFFFAAFLAGAFFFAVANSLTSFQVFSETTSFSLVTAKCKPCVLLTLLKIFFQSFFIHDTRLSLCREKDHRVFRLENMTKKAGWE